MGSSPSVVVSKPDDQDMTPENSETRSVATVRAEVIPERAKTATTFGTQALSDFLGVIGNCVADLNTIAVGLAAIGPDHVKPDGLNISWAPKDPMVAARKARKAAIHASMVVTVEALAQYIRATTNLPRFQKLTTEWNSRKPKPSLAEKFAELATILRAPIESVGEISTSDTLFRTYCVTLLIHWRNRHVHTDSNAELTHQEKQLVRSCEEHIRNAYAGLEVDRLFCDFQINRPTLKEASTLIAMTIQEVRAMDVAVYECQDLADVQAWLDHYKLNARIEKILRETKPERQYDSILRMLQTHAPYLKPWYEKFASKSVSALTQ